MGIVRALLVVGCALVAACRAHEFGSTVEPSPPSKMCHDPALGPDDVCLPAVRLERLLRIDPLPVRAVRPAGEGTSGARLAWLELPSEDLVFRAKWKPAPRKGERINNVPRKELAAYELQKLFLSPDEYVVPTTVARCLPPDFHASRFGDGHIFDGTRCVLGTLAYWIEHLAHDGVRDLDRFARDPRYRRAVGNLNVLTYVIDHRDTRKSNFLKTKNPHAPPRVFVVDNGLAFSGIRNPLAWFVPDWAHIIVPALPKDTIDRLRLIDRRALDRLAVVAQLRERADGTLEEVEHTAPTDEREGVRVTSGVVQLGLTRKEIDRVERRIRALLERVDAGELKLF